MSSAGESSNRQQETQDGTTSSSGKQHTNCSIYECNICLGTAKYPVVCYCGHLFCWPCLYQWMHTSLNRKNVCPVCKFKMDRMDPVIALYGRGSESDNDAPISDSIPPRPKRLTPSHNLKDKLVEVFEWPEPRILKIAVFSFLVFLAYAFFA